VKYNVIKNLTKLRKKQIHLIKLKDVGIGNLFRFNRNWCVRDSHTFFSWSSNNQSHTEEVFDGFENKVVLLKTYY